MKMFPGALQALQDKLVSFKQLTTKSSINRWTIPADRIPWSKFDEDWHHRWNLSRPVLLENSPPEIRFPERLLQQYNDKGDVRFIILARSPCNYDHEHVHERSSGLSWSMKFAHMREIATALGQAKPSRVFFLRYEDICDDAKGVMDALRTWLPNSTRFRHYEVTQLSKQ